MTTRLRANYVFGTTDNALNEGDGQSIFYSDGLTRLPALDSGGDDFYAVTLSDSELGVYEVVHIIGHAEDANVASLGRGQEGTAALAWPVGTKWVHGPTAADFVVDVPVVVEPEHTFISSFYKGAWDADTDYGAGDLVNKDGKLWEALVTDPNAVDADGPGVSGGTGTPEYVGGPAYTSLSPFSNAGLQQITFLESGVITGMRAYARLEGGGANGPFCGLCATRPNSPNEATYLRQVTVPQTVPDYGPYNGGPPAGTWGGDFATPLAVTAGQTLWMMYDNHSSGSSWMTANAGDAPVGNVDLGEFWYGAGGGSAFALQAGYQMLIQCLFATASEPVWGLALDFSQT